MKTILETLSFVAADVTTSAALPSIPPNAARAFVRVEDADCRWRADSGDAATDGMLMKTTDAPLAFDGDLSTFRIASTSGTAKLKVQYFGERSPTIG